MNRARDHETIEKRRRYAEDLVAKGTLWRKFLREMRDEFGISQPTANRDWHAAHKRLTERVKESATQEELARQAIVRLSDLKEKSLSRRPPDCRTAFECENRIMRLRGLIVVDSITQSNITVEAAREYARKVCDLIVEHVTDKATVEALIDEIRADSIGHGP